tara:strand:- start:849 stop:1088 length:240 start_codon:yes stop_codon:yes gene_type:complete
MKPTKADIHLFNEIKSKYDLKEGILSMIFKKTLKKALLKDKALQQALKDGDEILNSLKVYAKQAEADGRKVPAYIKKLL